MQQAADYRAGRPVILFPFSTVTNAGPSRGSNRAFAAETDPAFADLAAERLALSARPGLLCGSGVR